MTAAKTWGKGYVMVPGWLVKKKPSANAVLVYVHLGMHGSFNSGEGRYEQCRPSKKTLAKGDPGRGYPGCGLSEQTIGRALRELESLRAIKGEEAYDEKGGQLPTVYRLIFGELNEEEEETAAQTPISPVIHPSGATSKSAQPGTPGGHKSDTPGGDKSDTPRGVSDLIPNQEALDLEPENKKTPPGSLTEPSASEPSAVEDQNGGDPPTTEDPHPDGLDRLVAELTAMEGWEASKTKTVLETLRAQGINPAEIARVAREVAAGVHGVTRGPNRLLHWWPVTRPASPAAEVPAWAKSRNAELPLDVDRCRLHRGQPADGCNQCSGEAKGAEVDAPSTVAPVLSRAEALALARRNAGRSVTRGAGPVVPVVPSQGPAASLVALGEAAASVVGADVSVPEWVAA